MDERIELLAMELFSQFIRKGVGTRAYKDEPLEDVVRRRWNRAHETTREQFRIEARARSTVISESF